MTSQIHSKCQADFHNILQKCSKTLEILTPILKESDSRGLKDPEGYKRKVEERERAEERARASGGGPEGGGLLKVGRSARSSSFGICD